MFGLAGRSAVVVGGAGGLGAAICRALVVQGAAVIVADRDIEAAARVAGSLAGNASPVGIDVTDEDSVARAFAETSGRQGPIDTLVTAAGIYQHVRFEQTQFQDWRRMLAVHLDGTFLCARAALPTMLASGFGRIVCVSSMVAQTGVAFEVGYAAAKAGIDGLVRALAREVASRGVTVNAVAPGYHRTPANEGAPSAWVDAIVANTPLGRLGRPDEIGALVAYLASTEAGYLTGQIISPTGGFSYGSFDQTPLQGRRDA